ncbi:MAG TPA: Xaa-Pro aminopeptidase, partial [Gemmatimonadaceae bacterium]
MKQFSYTRAAFGAAITLALGVAPVAGQQIQTYRPFGTLRDQAARQQRWLDERMTTVLPALMRKHKVDMWVVP